MRTLSRRHLLRGAGVALALPFLESLAPRRAHALAASPRRKFVAIYFPLGSASFWKPSVGAGDGWTLSPILEPLTPLKDQVTVLGHVDQTAFGPPGFVSFGNGLLTGSYLTCVELKAGTPTPPAQPKNGISVDQRVAQALGVKSLQAGLSTLDSYCDGAPCDFSRSISWSAPVKRKPLQGHQPAVPLRSDRHGPADDHPHPPSRAGDARKGVLDFVIAGQRAEPRAEAQLLRPRADGPVPDHGARPRGARRDGGDARDARDLLDRDATHADLRPEQRAGRPMIATSTRT